MQTSISTKWVCKILINELVKKAKLNNIKQIYLESVLTANIFYKNIGFDSESDKKLFTDSEKKIELKGYVLDVDSYNMYQNNNTLDDTIILGGSNNYYEFNLYHADCGYMIDLFKNNEKIGDLCFNPLIHPILLYYNLEIDSVNGDKKLLISIFDNMCFNNYINNSCILTNDEEMMNILKELNYKYVGKKMKFSNFEKEHNQKHVIDRNVLSNKFNIE